MALKDKYFTISEAAKELGITRQTVSRWIKDGKLRAETIGREKLIEKEQLSDIHILDNRGIFGKMINAKFIDFLKERYYSEGDEIKVVGDDFIVTKSNGTQEIVSMGEHTLSFEFDDKKGIVQIKVIVKKVIRKPYKKNRKGGKQNK